MVESLNFWPRSKVTLCVTCTQNTSSKEVGGMWYSVYPFFDDFVSVTTCNRGSKQCKNQCHAWLGSFLPSRQAAVCWSIKKCKINRKHWYILEAFCFQQVPQIVTFSCVGLKIWTLDRWIIRKIQSWEKNIMKKRSKTVNQFCSVLFSLDRRFPKRTRQSKIGQQFCFGFASFYIETVLGSTGIYKQNYCSTDRPNVT